MKAHILTPASRCRIVSGVDLVEIDRIEEAIGRWGARFLERVYTAEERAQCRDRATSLAGRFAAKEAASKALGVGMRSIGWQEIEVLNDGTGKPIVRLRGRAADRAEALGVVDMEVSISHTRRDAIALAIGWSDLA